MRSAEIVNRTLRAAVAAFTWGSLGLAVLVLLTACGGGGSSPGEPVAEIDGQWCAGILTELNSPPPQRPNVGPDRQFTVRSLEDGRSCDWDFSEHLAQLPDPGLDVLDARWLSRNDYAAFQRERDLCFAYVGFRPCWAGGDQ